VSDPSYLLYFIGYTVLFPCSKGTGFPIQVYTLQIGYIKVLIEPSRSSLSIQRAWISSIAPNFTNLATRVGLNSSCLRRFPIQLIVQRSLFKGEKPLCTFNFQYRALLRLVCFSPSSEEKKRGREEERKN
jgi:hypothetical protein